MPLGAGFVQFLKMHSDIDAVCINPDFRVDYYRWAPVSGRKNTPGLVDTGDISGLPWKKL